MPNIFGNSIMGIVFTGIFALGLVLYTKVQTDAHLNHILFGNILGIERDDLLQTLIATASSVLASCLGVYVSFFLNAATGACIVLAQAAMFAGAMIWKNTRCQPAHGGT